MIRRHPIQVDAIQESDATFYDAMVLYLKKLNIQYLHHVTCHVYDDRIFYGFLGSNGYTSYIYVALHEVLSIGSDNRSCKTVVASKIEYFEHLSIDLKSRVLSILNVVIKNHEHSVREPVSELILLAKINNTPIATDFIKSGIEIRHSLPLAHLNSGSLLYLDIERGKDSIAFEYNDLER